MLEKDNSYVKKQMQLKGIPAAPGIVIGKAHIFGTEDMMPLERIISEAEIPKEVERLNEALKKTRKEIHQLWRGFLSGAGVM